MVMKVSREIGVRSDWSCLLFAAFDARKAPQLKFSIFPFA